MATVTITLTDLPDGKVEMHSTPSINEIIAKAKQHTSGGSKLTAAEGFAMTAFTAIRFKDKEESEAVRKERSREVIRL